MRSGHSIETSKCQSANTNDSRPKVPYGEQNKEDSLWFEDGYKECIGYLTEGRSLVFERNGWALTNPGGNQAHVTISRATKDHDDIKHRWVIHYTEDEESQIFKISSSADGRWIGKGGKLLPSGQKDRAAEIKITFHGNGKGYELQFAGSHNFIVDHQSAMKMQGEQAGFKVWSVTYHNGSL